MQNKLTRSDMEYAVANKISFADMQSMIEEEIAIGWEIVQNYESVIASQHLTVSRNTKKKDQL